MLNLSLYEEFNIDDIKYLCYDSYFIYYTNQISILYMKYNLCIYGLIQIFKNSYIKSYNNII